METRERIEALINMVTQSSILIQKRPIERNRFSLVKIKLYEIRERSTELQKEIFAQAKPELNKILADPCFPQLQRYLEKEIAKLSERDIAEAAEDYFALFQAELLPILKKINEQLEILLEFFILPSGIKVEYTKRYLSKKAKSSYKDNLGLINAVERKIEDYFISGGRPGGSKIAKRLMKEKTGELHAWVPEPLGNHRIVYLFDPKGRKILFLDLGTHKELGLGRSEG